MSLDYLLYVNDDSSNDDISEICQISTPSKRKGVEQKDLHKQLEKILRNLARGTEYTWNDRVLTQKEKEQLYEYLNHMITIIPIILDEDVKG